MRYEKSKYFPLTPSRKKIGKIIGRGNKKTIARTLLNDLASHQQLANNVGFLFHNELIYLILLSEIPMILPLKTLYGNLWMEL